MAVSRVSSSTSPEVAGNWGYTHAEVVRFSCRWTISNFSFFRQEIGKGLKSPTFSAAANDKSKWCIQLYPNDGNEKSTNCVSLYLVLVSTDKLTVTAKCKFSILNSRHEETKTREFEKVFRQGNGWGFSPFINRALLLDWAYAIAIPLDELTILCEVSVIGDPSDRRHFEVPESTFSEDLGNLFANGRFSDVTLAVGGQELQAHKGILAARSPVFAAMFEHEMEERKENRVTITDVDHEVVEEMLGFMYTDKAPNLAKMAEGLLAAADKYALEKLKAMCEVVLCLKLSEGTAAETLILADLHSAGHLKAQVIKFIIAHPRHVMNTFKWRNLLATHPHLIEEIFRAIATQ